MRARRDLIESLTQMVIGTALAQIVLALYGVTLEKAIALNLTMIVVSTIRQYVVRRTFRRLEEIEP